MLIPIKIASFSLLKRWAFNLAASLVIHFESPLEQAIFPSKLIEMGLATADQINQIKVGVDESVAIAVKFAEDSPEPELSEIHNDVLA